VRFLARRDGPRVLVVDDSIAMRRLILRGLRQCGVHESCLYEAVDATSALSFLDRARVDVLFVDQSLPDMPGTQLLGGLAESHGRRPSRVLVSADLSAETLGAAAGVGVPMVLAKPFGPEDLARALTGALPGPAELLAGAAGAATTGPTLPTAHQTEQLLTTLLSRPVTTTPGAPVLPRPGRRALTVAYVTRRLRTAAVLVADLPLATALTAALDLDPEQSLAEAMLRRQLPGRADQNLPELAEIATSLFVPAGGELLRTFAVHLPGQLPPPLTAAAVGALRRRLDVFVTIDGFGAGELSLVVPAELSAGSRAGTAG
jgi:two-component system chemotaxis response regulator CheY